MKSGSLYRQLDSISTSKSSSIEDEDSTSVEDSRPSIEYRRAAARFPLRKESSKGNSKGPVYPYPRPSDSELDALADGYELILGKKLSGYPRGAEPVRRLLSVIFRKHGPDSLRLLREVYDSTGTTHMLLSKVRDYPPRVALPPKPDDELGSDAFWTSVRANELNQSKR